MSEQGIQLLTDEGASLEQVFESIAARPDSECRIAWGAMGAAAERDGDGAAMPRMEQQMAVMARTLDTRGIYRLCEMAPEGMNLRTCPPMAQELFILAIEHIVRRTRRTVGAS